VTDKFKWIDWNTEHIALKGITPEEAESVFHNLARGYPRRHRKGYLIKGKSILDRWIQVAFAREPDNRIFVFHARSLTAKERKALK